MKRSNPDENVAPFREACLRMGRRWETFYISRQLESVGFLSCHGQPKGPRGALPFSRMKEELNKLMFVQGIAKLSSPVVLSGKPQVSINSPLQAANSSGIQFGSPGLDQFSRHRRRPKRKNDLSTFGFLLFGRFPSSWTLKRFGKGSPFFPPSELVFLTLPFFSTLKPCLGTVGGNLVSPTLRNPFFSTPHLVLFTLCLVFFTLRLVFFTRELACFTPQPCFSHPKPKTT